MHSVADACQGQGNTRWFKTVMLRCKEKAHEGPKVQLLHVHLPVVVVSRDCEGTKTWAFTVYGGPGSGKYEHVMCDSGVGVRGAGGGGGATWLQAAIRIVGCSPPPPPRG